MEKKFTLEELTETAFNIITNAGEAKSEAMLAIYASKKGKFDEAKEKLSLANKSINIASEQHFSLIQHEAQGNKIEIPLLLMHAEDQLLTTQTLILLAEEFVELYKKMELKKC